MPNDIVVISPPYGDTFPFHGGKSRIWHCRQHAGIKLLRYRLRIRWGDGNDYGLFSTTKPL